MDRPTAGAPMSPVLRASRVLAIALAAISPTTSVFLVYGGGLAGAGTGVTWSFALAAVIALAMALAYAELGGVHFGAGGAYTIVREVLGDGAGFVTLVLFLVLGVISTAAILVASATFLHQLVGALALFAYNGYDWPLYFGEETFSPRRTLPRAVLVAAGSAVVIELVAVVVATLSIRHLGAVSASASPLATIAESVAGRVGSKILLAGVVVAMFDTGLSANLGYARIYLASGRDGMWPGPINAWAASVNRNGVPKWAFAFLGVACAVFCYFSSLVSLITFTSVMIIAVYLLIAVSALVSRVRERGLQRPLRMWLWPLPPLVAIVRIGLTVRYQKLSDVVVTGSVMAGAIIYWSLFVRGRRGADG